MKKISIILAGLLVGTAANAQTAADNEQTEITYEFGDINKDTSINVFDVSRMVNTIGSESENFFDFEYDINGDGNVNVMDISTLVNYILGDVAPVRPVPCVDLGLSVTWAACNLGAVAEQEFGNYYAWGDTEAKSNYNSDNSVTYNKSMTHLMAESRIDSEGNLAASNDAATAALGEEWRMPTKDEINELLTKCTWENCDEYFPILGVRVTAPNGKSIFIPEAGEMRGDKLINEGFYGYFWSASCDDMADGFGESKGIALGFTGQDLKWVTSDVRYVGRSIRAVKEKNTMNNPTPEESEEDTETETETPTE